MAFPTDADRANAQRLAKASSRLVDEIKTGRTVNLSGVVADYRLCHAAIFASLGQHHQLRHPSHLASHAHSQL